MPTLRTKVLTGLGGTCVAVLATASPAFAAGSFVSPGDNSTVPVDSSGNPVATDVVTTGFPAATNVFLIVCDGVPPTASGYDATQHCDNTAGQGPIQSQGTSYQEKFTVANSNRAVTPFRGEGGSDTFNCLAPEDTKPGAAPKAGMGDVVPNGATTANGNPIDPAVPSWDDCQFRVSSNNSATTTDQSFITFKIPNTVNSGPQGSLPEVPLAIVLPIGAAALFASGYAINRRRRAHAA